MIGGLEGIRSGTADARAAEQLRLQREQAERQRLMQDMQLTQMRRAMEREDRTQADIDAAIAAWNDDGAGAPPAVGLAPPRNTNAPVGLEAPEPMAPPAGAAPGAPALGLSKLDRAVGTAALRQGDFDAAYKLKDRAKAESTDAARKAEFKRLMSLSEQDLTAAFEPMNANPGFKGMLSFDPKAKKFLLVSQIPGLETQSMTKEELVNSMMGIWEAGNGDFKQGMNMLMSGAQRRRDIDNSNFARSGELARADADAHFKVADDTRQARQVDAQIAHWNAQKATANAQGRALKWQQDRLERGDTLGREAAGYAQGLAQAKALGPEGRQAADIYNSLLQGTNQRMAGLGLRPYGVKDPVPPQVIAEEVRRLQETPQGAKMSYAALYQQVEAAMNGRGADPLAGAQQRFVQTLTGGAAPGAPKPAPTKPAVGPAAPAPAAPPPETPQQQAARIRAALAADDQLRTGGGGLWNFKGLANGGAVPMGVLERRGMEQRLQVLEGR